jgi:hypothetical protein
MEQAMKFNWRQQRKDIEPTETEMAEYILLSSDRDKKQADTIKCV